MKHKIKWLRGAPKKSIIFIDALPKIGVVFFLKKKKKLNVLKLKYMYLEGFNLILNFSEPICFIYTFPYEI